MIEGGYCRDCKWWLKSAIEYVPYPQRPGACDLSVGGATVDAVRYLTTMAAVGPRPDARIGGSAPILWTAPNFGCVQFQAEE